MTPARSDYGSYANSVIRPSYALRFPQEKSKAYIQSTASTLGSVLDDHIKLLRDIVSHLNSAVKQTQLSDYLAIPDRFPDSPLLQFIVDDRFLRLYWRYQVCGILSCLLRTWVQIFGYHGF